MIYFRRRKKMELLRLPTEMILLILEHLLRIDPVTLLGAVPGVCTQLVLNLYPRRPRRELLNITEFIA